VRRKDVWRSLKTKDRDYAKRLLKDELKKFDALYHGQVGRSSRFTEAANSSFSPSRARSVLSPKQAGCAASQQHSHRPLMQKTEVDLSTSDCRAVAIRPDVISDPSTLYGARRSVIESLGWLSTLFVLGASRASPLTIVKHAKELSAPTAIVQSRCLQNQRTSLRLRRHLRREPRNR